MVTNVGYLNFRINVPVGGGGEYRFCFDNTYSHFTPKQIAFTITTSNPDEADWQGYQEIYNPEDSYDIQVNEIKVNKCSLLNITKKCNRR